MLYCVRWNKCLLTIFTTSDFRYLSARVWLFEWKYVVMNIFALEHG